MTMIEDFSWKGRKGRGLPVCGVAGEGVSWAGQNGQGFVSVKEFKASPFRPVCGVFHLEVPPLT